MNPNQTSLDDLRPAVDLTAYPDSSVPAAFDRGHLFSPRTLEPHA